MIPNQVLLANSGLDADEQDAFIPQWAVAVIVIGIGSLLFIIVFGIAVVSYINYV